MGRAMKQAITIRICAVVIIAGMANVAHAGRWEWGCIGTTGDKQVVFNRYHLIVAPAKPPRGKIHDLIFFDDLAKGSNDIEQYNAADVNSGLTPKMVFTLGEDEKRTITLTEKSSRAISHHAAMVCGRDEDTDVSRKVYRYQRTDEPAGDITMQCMEYMLTSRGGRPCINRR
jgi:hypothetical protein